MSKLPDILRTKVDAMRGSAAVAQRSQADAMISLARLAEQSAKADALPQGIVHLCPWNTCQATRHG